MLVLVRIDEPEYKIALVRFHDHFAGWFGYTARMLENRRCPCLFPKAVWRIDKTEGVNS